MQLLKIEKQARMQFRYILLLGVVLLLFTYWVFPYGQSISYGPAEGGEYIEAAKDIEIYWERPSLLQFPFHIIPNHFGKNPLFVASLGYTRLILTRIGIPVARFDSLLNLILIMFNSLIIFLILQNGLQRSKVAFLGSLFYGFSAVNLEVAVTGFHTILGSFFLLLAIYLAIKKVNIYGLRPLVIGGLLSCSIVASTHTIPPVIGLILYLLGRALVCNIKTKSLPALPKKMALFILGFTIPLGYFFLRDSWLQSAYVQVQNKYTYVLEGLFVQAQDAMSQGLPILARFYLDYLYALDGPISVGILLISLVFILFVSLFFITGRKFPRGFWINRSREFSLLLIAVVVGGTTYLLLTLGRLPAIGRAYAPIKVSEALVFGVLVAQIYKIKVRRKSLSWLLASITPLIVCAQLFSTVAFVKSADRFYRHYRWDLSVVKKWDPDAILHRVSEFELLPFLEYLRQGTKGGESEYFALAAPSYYFRHHDFEGSELLSYLAYLMAKTGLKPIASVKGFPDSKYFVNEHVYYNLYLGNAVKTFPELPWLKVIPVSNDTIFRVSDLRRVYNENGYLVKWENGDFTSKIGWRRLVDPNRAVWVKTEKTRPKTWVFNGSGGLSLCVYVNGTVEEHGIAPKGNLLLGFWIKIPVIKAPTYHPILTIGLTKLSDVQRGGLQEYRRGYLSLGIVDSKLSVFQDMKTIGKSLSPIEKGQWIFVVVGIDEDRLKLWLDGKPDGIFQFQREPLPPRGLTIGYDPLNRFPPLPNGTEIAQVFYADRIASDREVRQMYLSSLATLFGLDLRGELVSNGRFEDWSLGAGPFTNSSGGILTADNWWQYIHGPASFTSRRSAGDEDSDSQRTAAVHFSSEGGTGDYAQKVEVSDLLGGKTITFSIRVRTSTGTAVRPFIWMDAGGAILGNFHSGSGTYQTLSVRAAVPRAGENQLWVGVRFLASASASLGKASLRIGSSL